MHLRGQSASAAQGRGKPKDLGKKAVLLSGPPGIGKTTSAMIITRYCHIRTPKLQCNGLLGHSAVLLDIRLVKTGLLDGTLRSRSSLPGQL